ncbi:MAG: radical SAM protein, partial [Candidatus Omnitrophica bacterium]|nr:radical SAM protein [Candidatus Omnitrophota bacterium]
MVNSKVDYLRISVTDRCNLRCIYCFPFEKKSFLPHSEILSYEEIADIVKMLSETGIRKVRLTGGEPLVRRKIESLIKLIKMISSISEISMTTNGLLLGEKAF